MSLFADYPNTSDSMKTVLIAVAHAATTDSAAFLPAGSYVHSCQLVLSTAYTAGATITVGQVGSLASFMAATDNNPQGTAGDIYAVEQLTAASNAIVRVTIAGSPSVGASTVLIKYSVPRT